MNGTLYKTTTVQRGYTYRYFYSRPTTEKSVLLFLHGFPSTSYDWHRQVDFFTPLGYGVLAPDLLGFGGTAKPLDYKEYRMNAMAEDVMDILKAEGVEKVVGVGHDWGSALLSRLVMLYPETISGLVWIGLGFTEPSTTPFDLDAMMAVFKSIFGTDGGAYWRFFTRPDAAEIIRKNVDSFTQLLYPDDPDSWLKYIVTEGGTAECIEGNKLLGRPSWLSEEEYLQIRQEFVTNGVTSSLQWYISQMNDNIRKNPSS